MSIVTTKSTVAESELYTDIAWFIITVCSISNFAKNNRILELIYEYNYNMYIQVTLKFCLNSEGLTSDSHK